MSTAKPEYAGPINEVALNFVGRGATDIKTLHEFIKNYTPVDGRKLRIVSIDPNTIDKLGGLAAVNTENFPEWGLNVPVKSMSFFTSEPKDFLEFLNNPENQQKFRKKYSWFDSFYNLQPNEPKVFKEGEYVPRAFFYRDYLSSKWEELTKLAEEKGIDLQTVVGKAENYTPLPIEKDVKGQLAEISYSSRNESGEVEQKSGIFDILVSAVGNTAPPKIKINTTTSKRKTDDRVIQEPLKDIFTAETLRAAKESGQPIKVIIKGFGNTGIDLAVAVDKLAREAGVEVEIIGIQRHSEGIVKHTSRKTEAYPAAKFKGITKARDFWQAIREGLQQASFGKGDLITPDGQRKDSIKIGDIDVSIGDESKPYDPQGVIDVARAAANIIWAGMDPDQQAEWLKEEDEKGDPSLDALYRFLRNRTTPETGAKLENLINSDGPVKLRLVKGEITSVRSNGEDEPLSVSFDAEINGRNEGETIAGNNVYVLNAVGPAKELEKDGFLKQFRAKSIVARSHIGGISFLANSFFAKVANGFQVLIASLSHNISKFLESSGFREKRDQAAEFARELQGKVEELFQDKEKGPHARRFSAALPVFGWGLGPGVATI